MNICVVSPGYPASEIPQYTFVEQLCNALADLGVQITVIAPQSITKSIIRRKNIIPYCRIVKTVNNNKITVYAPTYISVGNLPKIGIYMNYANFSQAVSRTFKKLPVRPDICYGHFWHTAYGAYSSVQKSNIPLFVASGEAEIELHRFLKKNQLKSFRDYVKGVICVSSKNKQESIDSGLTINEKCEVIPNAIDDNFFHLKDKNRLRKLFGFSDTDFIVAFVGGFIHRKGTLRIAEAITRLNDPEIKSIFIGATQDGDKCDPQCEGILFKGKLHHEKIPDYLNCADVFVMPTLHEGCCNANIEALACGLPVISSDRSFNYDILDKSCSILIDPMNVQEIADAIATLKSDPFVRVKMSKAAVQKAKEFTISERAVKIINFIQREID